MRKILAIATFEIKRMFQKPQSYLLMFGMPILFTFIFGGLFSGETEVKPRIAVVDHDYSPLSLTLIKELKSKGIMEINIEDDGIAKTKFKEHKITGYIQIDEGFETQIMKGKIPKIEFVHSPSFTGSTIVEQMINDSILKLNIGVVASRTYQAAIGGSSEGVYKKITNKLATTPSGINRVTITKNNELTPLNNMTARSAGFSIMFVMMTMLISTGVLLEARQTGVWYRIMSTPTSKKELLIGYLLAFFLIGWIQFGVLMIISKFVFHVHWGNLIGNVVLVSSLLLCTIGLGLFIAGFAKTSEQQSVFGNLIIISTCMIAGVYWPVDIMPNFMQQIAKFVPQYWGLEGFAQLAARGGSVVDILLPSGILLAFTIVFLMIGMMRIRFQ